jgi:hypothetical protein
MKQGICSLAEFYEEGGGLFVLLLSQTTFSLIYRVNRVEPILENNPQNLP